MLGRQRGDTIIEVLLAITVFSLIAVGAITVMNAGTSSAQRALEVTFVKQQIDAQAEALRAAQQDFAATRTAGTTPDPNSPWKLATNASVGNSTVTVGASCPATFGNNFAMNGRTGDFINSSQLKSMNSTAAPPYAQTIYNVAKPTQTGPASQNSVTGVYGLWISKAVDTSISPAAYDFTIHACWYGPGTNVPMQLQTTVRLYDVA